MIIFDEHVSYLTTCYHQQQAIEVSYRKFGGGLQELNKTRFEPLINIKGVGLMPFCKIVMKNTVDGRNPKEPPFG